MPSAMERFTEVYDVLAALGPTAANAAAGAHVTGYFSMADAHRAFALLHVGTPGQGATINVTVQEATDALGTGAQGIVAKAPAQIVAADADGYVGIEFQSEELDMSNGYDFLQITVTVANAAFYYSLVVLGGPLRYEPAATTDFIELVP